MRHWPPSTCAGDRAGPAGPDYVHQVLLIEELARHGCRVEFLDRPMSDDPHDQLVLQIRGAVAEYERTLIAERMRRGRLAKLRAGCCCRGPRRRMATAWTPSGPGIPPGCGSIRCEAALVAQMFGWYLEPQATIYRLARRLTELGGGDYEGQAALEPGQRARHPAQPRLYRPGANQPHPGSPGPPP